MAVKKSAKQKSSKTHKIDIKSEPKLKIRQSLRKTKKQLQIETLQKIQQKVLGARDDGLTYKILPEKGRSLFSTSKFQRGDFVVEYAGELLEMSEAKLREWIYGAQDKTGSSYMYYFQFKSSMFCVDATPETNRLGRLVNHSRNCNLFPKILEIGEKPRLLLFAKTDIEAGVELTIDYGDRRGKSIKAHPWLAE